MKDKTITPQIRNLISGILVFALIGLSPSIYGQVSQELPGPVSQLTLNNRGEIECVIHTNDQVASKHHAIGNSKTMMSSNGRTQQGQSKKVQDGAQIFVFYRNLDPTFSDKDFNTAVTAFQSAVDIWASQITSDVPIFVLADFSILDEGVLGSAGPTLIYANVPGLERDTWYGNALADKLVSEDLSPQFFDIVANFSTVFPNWYFGTDGNTPQGDFDFRTVVLHELCHGLGFFGSMFVDNATGIGDYGFGIPNPVYPAIYDRLANSPDGKSILKENRYGNFTTELGNVLLGDPLTVKGPRIKKATTGKGAKLFTVLDSDVFGEIPGLTDIWLPGSSYSHLDFLTYAGAPNGLMVPFLSRGLAYENPGEITLAIYDDLGWNEKVNREVMADNSSNGSGDDSPELGSETSSALTIYPNPFVNSIAVDMVLETRSILKATVYDMYGASMQIPKKNIQGNSIVNIDLSKLRNRSDLYFLQLTFDNGDAEIHKIIRNN